MLRAGTAGEDARLRNLASEQQPKDMCMLESCMLWCPWFSHVHVCTHADRRITGSLFLQQVIYYQLFYDIAWITFWICWLFEHVGGMAVQPSSTEAAAC